MRVLLIYPLFPKSFWSFDKSLALINRQALLPPLGLITVAAILPQEWEFKLVDALLGFGVGVIFTLLIGFIGMYGMMGTRGGMMHNWFRGRCENYYPRQLPEN